MTVSAVWFDLDGTLLDTAPNILNAFNQVLQEHGREPYTREQMIPHISGGSVAMLGSAFPGQPWEAMQRRLFEIYQSALADNTCLFPGISELLGELKAQNIPWGIVTNKTTAMTLPLLDHFGLREACAVVVCGDTLTERKPSPKPLLHACVQTSHTPEGCWFVGDSESDILAGKAAGMTTVLAQWGYGLNASLAKEADYTLSHPIDLMKIMRRR